MRCTNEKMYRSNFISSKTNLSYSNNSGQEEFDEDEFSQEFDKQASLAQESSSSQQDNRGHSFCRYETAERIRAETLRQELAQQENLRKQQEARRQEKEMEARRQEKEMEARRQEKAEKEARRIYLEKEKEAARTQYEKEAARIRQETEAMAHQLALEQEALDKKLAHEIEEAEQLRKQKEQEARRAREAQEAINRELAREEKALEDERESHARQLETARKRLAKIQSERESLAQRQLDGIREDDALSRQQDTYHQQDRESTGTETERQLGIQDLPQHPNVSKKDAMEGLRKAEEAVNLMTRFDDDSSTLSSWEKSIEDVSA